MQSLKSINPKQLLEFLPTYKGTVLQTIPKMPTNFTITESKGNRSLRREYLYQDFKEAWSYFQLFSTACYKLGYRPAIFNVYNKIIIQCSSSNESGVEEVTTKDLFVAFLINQVSGNQGEQAYRNALEQFKNAV